MTRANIACQIVSLGRHINRGNYLRRWPAIYKPVWPRARYTEQRQSHSGDLAIGVFIMIVRALSLVFIVWQHVPVSSVLHLARIWSQLETRKLWRLCTSPEAVLAWHEPGKFAKLPEYKEYAAVHGIADLETKPARSMPFRLIRSECSEALSQSALLYVHTSSIRGHAKVFK